MIELVDVGPLLKGVCVLHWSAVGDRRHLGRYDLYMERRRTVE